MSDFLSQEEIDALLRGAVGDESEEAAGSDLPEDGSSGPDVDQGSPGFQSNLDELEKDALAEVGNISMGAAATALSSILDHKVSITVPAVSLTTTREVQERYPIPCLVITVSYVEGLQGRNLLIIKERDAAVIASLMMGEDGSNPPEVLTDLHVSAVTEAMNQMIGSSATAMSDMFGTRIGISPPEVERLDLAVTEDPLTVSEPLVQVAFRLQVGGLIDSEMLQLTELDFARSMVQELMASEMHMSQEAGPEQEIASSTDDMSTAGYWGDAGPTDGHPEPAPWHSVPGRSGGPEHGHGELGNLNIELIRNIPVRIRAILGRSRLPIETILRLGPGSIVELDTLDGEPIEILANDILIAKGEVVVVGEQFGVRITEIVSPRERISTIQ